MKVLGFAALYFLWPPLAWNTRLAFSKGTWGSGWFHYVVAFLLAYFLFGTARAAMDEAWGRTGLGVFLSLMMLINLVLTIRVAYAFRERTEK